MGSNSPPVIIRPTLQRLLFFDHRTHVNMIDATEIEISSNPTRRCNFLKPFGQEIHVGRFVAEGVCIPVIFREAGNPFPTACGTTQLGLEAIAFGHDLNMAITNRQIKWR
jgi:hypothetical protein